MNVSHLHFLDRVATADAHPQDTGEYLMSTAFKLIAAERGTPELDCHIVTSLGFNGHMRSGQAFWNIGDCRGLKLRRLPMWTSHLPESSDFELAVTGWACARGYPASALMVTRAPCSRWSASLIVARAAVSDDQVEGRSVSAQSEPLARMAAALNLIAKLLGWQPRASQPTGE